MVDDTSYYTNLNAVQAGEQVTVGSTQSQTAALAAAVAPAVASSAAVSAAISAQAQPAVNAVLAANFH